MQASNIDEVLDLLDGILADCTAQADPLGYFPALYRQVTLKVKQGIAAGFFDNGARLDTFDADFANRFFAAYSGYLAGTPISQCWQVAFDAMRSGEMIILQDLVVGINAHINLDLGVVTGESFQGPALAAFHDDFNKINQILATLTPPVEAVVARFSPLIGLLERIGGKDAMAALHFSLDAARDDAWRHAQLLSVLPPSSWPTYIEVVDSKVTFLAKLIVTPGRLTRRALDLIKETESRDVPAIIGALNSIVTV
jgi:hypothetical protein